MKFHRVAVRLTVMEAAATPENESYSHRATETTEDDFTEFFVRSVRDLILRLAARQSG